MANEEHRVFPARPDIYDRNPALPNADRVWIREAKLAQGSEINEGLTIAANQARAIGDMVARDGDRLEGADVLVAFEEDDETGTVTLAAGVIYLRGKPRPVAAAVLEEVPVEGDVQIGVRVTSTEIDHEDNPLLLGLHEGSASYGEPGAIRETLTIAWAWGGDEGTGAFYPVYFLRDGSVVDQSPPPSLTGINNALAVYDYDAHKHYIVRGCQVSALGLSAGKQVFSIAAGVANILGFKRTRNVDTRYEETETPDLAEVVTEPHTYVNDGGSSVIELRRGPIAAIAQAVVTKSTTQTIVKGVANGTDLLPHSSVTAITAVSQSASPILSGWVQDGDGISWAGGGPEPSPGSSYEVTYRYLAPVVPTDVTATTVELTGGVDGQPAFISYSYKLPRVDRICFDRDGNIVYLKGLSVADQPQPPTVPDALLAIAEVRNDWFGPPRIANNGTRAIPFNLLQRYLDKLVDTIALVGLERLQRRADARAEAAKRGLFVDPFVDDVLRDAGAAQTAAVFNGSCQIAIDPVFHSISLSGPQTLAFTEDFVIRQEFVTGCSKINPYQSFVPLPAKLSITPERDFWSERQETWLSDQTRVFGQGNNSRVTSTEVVSSTQTVVPRFLREIDIDFRIEEFGVGETLTLLQFAGVDVTPAGPLVADSGGVVEGSFTVPANITAGTKEVVAIGGSGAQCAARFTGEGLIEVVTLQRVTNISQWSDPPAPPARALPLTDFVGFNLSRGTSDPLAQSFTLPFGQHVTGVDVKFCAIGDTAETVLCEIVTMENGFPTTQVIAQTEIDMSTVLLNTWTTFSLPIPLYLSADRQFAFVLKTNDPDHAVSFGRRGGFDTALQAHVSAQPYTVGVMFSSSNAETWTAHQDDDLTFRLRAARFAPTSRTIPLGTFAASDVSDILVRGDVRLPTDAARVLFRVTVEGEPPILLEPDQVWERTSFTDEDVTIDAIMTGNEFVSPILGRDLLAIFGTMRASGTYISRKFDMGADVRIDAIMRTRLPTGSTLTVEKDDGDGPWESLPETVAKVLGDGWVERTYSDASFVAPTGGRIKLTLTGTPAARPSVADLEAFSI